MVTAAVRDFANHEQVRNTLEEVCKKVPRFKIIGIESVMTQLMNDLGPKVMNDTTFAHVFRFQFVSSKYSNQNVLAIEVVSAGGGQQLVSFKNGLPEDIDWDGVNATLSLMSRKHANVEFIHKKTSDRFFSK